MINPKKLTTAVVNIVYPNVAMLQTILACFALGTASQGSPLDGMRALDAKLTFRSEAQPVEEVLRSLSTQTKVKLEAAKDIRGDRVVIYAEETPAREILDVLAKHLGWSWEHDGDVMRLVRTPGQRIAEEKAAQEEIMSQYRAFRDKAKAHLNDQATAKDVTDYREALEESGSLIERYDAEYYSKDPDIRSKWIAEDTANEAKRKALAQRLSPSWRLFYTVVAGLGDVELMDLDRTSRLVYSYNPTSWQRPIPSAAASIAEQLVQNLSFESHSGPARDVSGMNRSRDMMLEARRSFKPEEVGTVRLTLKNENLAVVDNWVLYLTPTITVLSKSGEILSESHVDLRDNTRPPAAVKPAEHPRDRFDEKLVVSDDLKAADEAATRDRRNWSSLKAVNLATEEFLKPKSMSIPAVGEAKLLIELARAAHANLISDLYDRQGWCYGAQIPLGTARSALDSASKTVGSRWQLSDNWIQMRSKDWELSRLCTLPAADLAVARDRLIADQGSFDNLAELLVQLSDRQIRSSLMQVLLRQAFPWMRFGPEVYLMRFWGSLTRDVKAGMLAGKAVPFSSLMPRQQGYVADYVYRQNERRYETMISAYGNDAKMEQPDLDWMRQAWPGFGNSNDWMADMEPTQWLPKGIPPGTLITVRASQGHALVVSNNSGWSMPMTEQMAVGSGYYDPKKNEFLVVPATEDRLYFTLAFAPALALGYEFTRIHAEAGLQAKPYSELPDDIKTRLSEGYAARHGG